MRSPLQVMEGHLQQRSLFDFHSKLANYQSNNGCMLVIALTHYVFFETKSKVTFLMATVIINIHFFMYILKWNKNK
jgi:hypothetical protein